MSRYIKAIRSSKSADAIITISEDFLRKEGFSKVIFKGEDVWKKGIGFLTSPQFIKLDYSDGGVRLEAWLKFAWLPGIYSGEMGLSGAFGFAVKQLLKARVARLESLLK